MLTFRPPLGQNPVLTAVKGQQHHEIKISQQYEPCISGWLESDHHQSLWDGACPPFSLTNCCLLLIKFKIKVPQKVKKKNSRTSILFTSIRECTRCNAREVINYPKISGVAFYSYHEGTWVCTRSNLRILDCHIPRPPNILYICFLIEALFMV